MRFINWGQCDDHEDDGQDNSSAASHRDRRLFGRGRGLPRSPLPWLHIAAVVADEAAARGYRRLGITGTRWLVDSDVYPEQLAQRGIAWLRPDEADRVAIGTIIMDELVAGIIRPASVAIVQRVIERFREQGCDAVVLGCTEIPLIINDANAALPTLDSTRLLARAALHRAIQ